MLLFQTTTWTRQRGSWRRTAQKGCRIVRRIRRHVRASRDLCSPHEFLRVFFTLQELVQRFREHVQRGILVPRSAEDTKIGTRTGLRSRRIQVAAPPVTSWPAQCL